MRALLEGPAASWSALLLLVGPRARAAGWGPEGALAIATEAAADGRPVVLADLGFADPTLHRHLGVPNDEGAADIVLFGASIRRTAQPVEELGFAFLPAGDAPDAEEALTHPDWAVARSEVARLGGILLFYAPSDAPGVGEFAARVGNALLLAEPDEAEEVRRALGPGCDIAAVIAPDAEPAPIPAFDTGSAVAEPALAAGAASIAHSGSSGDEADAVLSDSTRDAVPLASSQASTSGAASAESLLDPLRSDAAPVVGADRLEGGSAGSEAAELAPAAGSAPLESASSTAQAPDSASERDDSAPIAPFATASAEAVVSDLSLGSSVESHDGETHAAETVPAVAALAGERLADQAEPLDAHVAAPADVGGTVTAPRIDVPPSEEREARESGGDAGASVDVARESGAPNSAALPVEAPSEGDARTAGTASDAGDAATPAAPPQRKRRREKAERAVAYAADAEPPVEARAATRYSVPHRAEWQEWIIRVVAVVTLAYGVYYVSWRWLATLNRDALWFSIPLALAETWGLLTAFIMVHSVWRLKRREPIPPPPGLNVDVFITCFDEPLEVIRRTAVGARSIRYPHRTYLLDDGKRDEVKAMAEQLGIEYLRRAGNEHAKAGNMNHALANTTGDFVLQLDADHVPLPQILDRLLGFFQDPKLAFVQSPQDFYNTDGFTYDVNESWQRIWEEQRLFFSVIQPGKDSINGAFFCGSCAVFRREALESIGGFGTHSITEDIETSLQLHAAGWKSAYYGESLAYGLAAGSATAFHIQHLRWGQGAMQVIRRFNPLTFPGLTLSQRVSYFGSLTAYVGGVQKLVFYSAPLVFFLTGALPIRAVDREFLLRFLPFLLLSFVLSELVSRGTANTWISERYQMAKFWTYTRAVLSVLWPRPLRFNVTPKGPGHVPFRTYAPHVVLMATTLVAITWATLAHRNGWVDYGVAGWASTAFRVNLLWASLNFILAASVVGLSLRVRTKRGDHRFREQFPITIRTLPGENGKPRAFMALTEDLNPNGVAFRTSERLAHGSAVRLKLPLTTGAIKVTGRVVHIAEVEGGGPARFRVGVAFDAVSLRVRDAIELHCIQHAVPLERAQYDTPRPLLGRGGEWARNGRRERREQVRLPARVWIRREPGAPVEPGRRMALLAEISAGGARLVMDEPVAPGALIRFVVPGTRIRGVGRAVFSHATETPIGVRFAIGVRRRGGSLPRQQPVPERKMAIPYVLKRAVSLLCIPVALGAAAAPAAAQLQAVVYGGTEFDTQDLALFMLGASVHTTGLGPGLGVGVLGYNLTFPVDADRTETLNGFQPQVELRYGLPTGSVQANVGYLFVDGKDVVAVGAPTGAENGLVTALQANYWGSEGGASGDAIASYNWGGEYFWGRVRGLQQVAPLRSRGGVSLGAEVVAQGTTGNDDYRAFQVGPVVEAALSPAFRLTGVVGAKLDNRDAAPSVFPYVKLEFVAIPGL